MFEVDFFMEGRVVMRRRSIAAALRKAYTRGEEDDEEEEGQVDATASSLPDGWALLDWIEFINMQDAIEYRAWETELADGARAYRWRVHGVFSSAANLRDFPFDRTELQIRVSASKGVNMIRLVENKLAPSLIQVSNFMLGGGWVLQPAVRFAASVTPPSHSRSGTSRPLGVLSMYMDRKPAYYVLNIGFPLALIDALSFTSFAIDAADLPSRLNVTLTLVLTAVAYKFVLAQSIPAVSYMTVLDKYVLAQLAFLSLMAVENVVSGSLVSPTAITALQAALFALWLAFHVLCVIVYRACLRKPPMAAAPTAGRRRGSAVGGGAAR